MSSEELELLKAIQAKSDQLNADDLIAGPITGKIVSVKCMGSKEQPYHIQLDCWTVPFKPCKSMLRVMAACWGKIPREWAGKSMTLYNDTEVVYAGLKCGGVRISHVSDIESDMTIYMTKTRGKKAPFVVRRLDGAKVDKKPADEPVEQPMYPADKFNENFPKWEALIASGDKTADQILAAVQKGGRLTVGQVDRIKAVVVNPPAAEDTPEMEEGNPFEGDE